VSETGKICWQSAQAPLLSWVGRIFPHRFADTTSWGSVVQQFERLSTKSYRFSLCRWLGVVCWMDFGTVHAWRVGAIAFSRTLYGAGNYVSLNRNLISSRQYWTNISRWQLVFGHYFSLLVWVSRYLISCNRRFCNLSSKVPQSLTKNSQDSERCFSRYILVCFLDCHCLLMDWWLLCEQCTLVLLKLSDFDAEGVGFEIRSIGQFSFVITW
jgi:hypothetical protein